MSLDDDEPETKWDSEIPPTNVPSTLAAIMNDSLITGAAHHWAGSNPPRHSTNKCKEENRKWPHNDRPWHPAYNFPPHSIHKISNESIQTNWKEH
eukprot:scaffold11999_cov56-Attheya_sp.AAC.2